MRWQVCAAHDLLISQAQEFFVFEAKVPNLRPWLDSHDRHRPVDLCENSVVFFIGTVGTLWVSQVWGKHGIAVQIPLEESSRSSSWKYHRSASSILLSCTCSTKDSLQVVRVLLQFGSRSSHPGQHKRWNHCRIIRSGKNWNGGVGLTEPYQLDTKPLTWLWQRSCIQKTCRALIFM